MTYRNTLRLVSDRKESFFAIEEVIFCEGSGNYTRLFLKDGQSTEYYTIQIGKLAEKLSDHDFIRINRNCLVNLYYAKTLMKGKQNLILLENGQKLVVSYRRAKEIKKRMKQHCL